MFVSPDGKWLFAAIEQNILVMIIDTATLTIAMPNMMIRSIPERAGFSPNSMSMYPSAEEADSVDNIALELGDVIKSVKVGDRPRGIGFLPDGSRAYVAAENADTVNVFDTKTQDVIARIKAGKRSNGVTVH